jgi:hypothetical protein
MTFGQRLVNTVATEVFKLGLYMFAELPTDKMLKKHFGKDVPPLSELNKRTSLILVNSHFSLNNPRPTVPGFVEVGGIHIQSNGILPKVIMFMMFTTWGSVMNLKIKYPVPFKQFNSLQNYYFYTYSTQQIHFNPVPYWFILHLKNNNHVVCFTRDPP